MRLFWCLCVALTWALPVSAIVTASAPQTSAVLLFSHNIHAEMVPCGCNRFPLGGIAQVAGLLNHYRKQYAQVLYADIGDTFFPLPVLFAENRQTKIYHAQMLAGMLSDLGPLLYVPGDNDFAAGISVLAGLSAHKGIQLFVSNLRPMPGPLHSERFLQVNLKNGRRLFLISILAPQLLEGEAASLLEDPNKTLAAGVEWFQKRSDPKDSDVFILLSHSGMAQDREYARSFGQLHWIIGSHSQEFLYRPVEEGKIKIVQAQAQNHYIGALDIPAEGELSYQLIKMTDDWAKKIHPNPFLKRVQLHQKKMRQMERKEQLGQLAKLSALPLATVASFHQCRQCHGPQHDFWTQTPHSLAYLGLFSKKAEFNRDCVSCHALDKDQVAGLSNKYHQDLRQLLTKIKKEVRDLSAQEISATTKFWDKLDQKHKLTHNYANVQCLNCHDQAAGHPNAVANSPLDKVRRKEKIQARCLACHTWDQTPTWYGPQRTVDQASFDKAYASMSCPGQ